MTHRRIALTPLLIVAGLIVGCGVIGGDDDLAPTATPAPTQALVAATQPPSPTAQPAPVLTPTPAAPTTYVVEAGDNPTLIAEKLGVPGDEVDAWVAEMLALNDTEATFLQVGQELVLPPIAGSTATGATPETPASATPGGQAEATATTPAEASPTPGESATPAPTAAGGSFGDGIRTVGLDVSPGTYRTRQASEFCYWARLSGFSGNDSDIIADSVDEGGVSVVTIVASDAGFESDGCGTWTTDLSSVTSSPQAAFSDGTYIVGTDIAPGTWSTSDATDTCYWERTSGFGASLEEVIDSNAGSTVTIEPSDTGFYTAGCGTWNYVP